jgi:acyl-ACP thioesterase
VDEHDQLAQEFVPPPADGRTYAVTRRVHLGDVDTSATLKLEALARYLQDVATDDADDSGLDQFHGVWVVRRLAIAVHAMPRFHDRVDLTTFCSGTGPCWAERRTTLRTAAGVAAEAASLWVYLDDAGGRPQPLADDFFAIYGTAARRRVSPRLRHPAPPASLAARSWPLRDSDFDVLDHVNNARYFEAVEDELVDRMPGRRVLAVEAEWRGAVERGDLVELQGSVEAADGMERLRIWLAKGDDVRMSAVVTAGPRG